MNQEVLKTEKIFKEVHCGLCGKPLGYDEGMLIDLRPHPVDAAGIDLCDECDKKIYG